MTADASAENKIQAPRWLLYGANGYTGELIARAAAQRGFQPILAGRSAKKIAALARELKCEPRIFSVADQTATLVALEGVAVVLNCAGPFSQTAGRIMQACLASHVHYLDITGEIDVFELAHRLDEKAQRAHMALIPGVGFDVVPTDCVAASLSAALPDAIELSLAFESKSRASVGTAKTSIESLGYGSRIRRDGKIISVPFKSVQRTVDLGEGPRNAIAIPWGDVSTAYFTTGIPNIKVYLVGSAEVVKRLRQSDRWNWLLRRSLLKWILRHQVARGPSGPTQTERECNPMFVWGEAINAAGTKKIARLRTGNGYAVTVHAALAIVERVLENPQIQGFYTPSQLMGAKFVETLPGSSELRIDSAIGA